MKKALIAVAVILVLGAVVGLTIWRARSGYTKVLTAKVVRENLVSTVSATGQIKPKEYVNLGATAFGRITHLYVKEGEKVHKGEIVATIENVQQDANVLGQKAAILAARRNITADIAAQHTAQANIAHAMAQLSQARSQWVRAKALYKAQVMSRQDYDTARATYLTDVASVQQARDQLTQNKAQTAAAQAQLLTQQATLKANEDLLSKTVAVAPFDGIVTNLPVRVGETVVEGIQNSEGSTLMTIANMSSITAEVMVDEDDIVNVAIGQPVSVSVDALPGQTFQGTVTEVGDQALLRSTGVSTSQSTAATNEAKDFKVVVTLKDPSHKLKPGLSCTAKITTATADNAIAIPIQALTLRTPASLKKESASAIAAASASEKADQGVFVISQTGKPRVHFVKVKTGITGTTNIQVLSGLKPGEEIVIGPYSILRTLKNGALIKREKTGLSSNQSSS
ncbi:MAG: efflux RND transporter periplasmic adaptor subunit [Acidobacteriaceae bacterium]